MQLSANEFFRFETWMEGYFAAGAEDRPAMVDEGVAMAEARRDGMIRLLETNQLRPGHLIGAEVREKLPPAIRAKLEKPFSGKGVLKLFVKDDFERGVARYDFFWESEGRMRRAYPLANASRVPINNPLEAEGFALGSRIILTRWRHPSP